MSHITALVQQRRDARHTFRRRVKIGRHTFSITDLLRDHMKPTQHLDLIGWRAATEPIRVDPSIGQGVQQTERIVYIKRGPREMIAIIIPLQGFQCLLRSNAEVVGQATDPLVHLLPYLLLHDAAERGVLGEHTDVLYIVQLAEDTQLGKLRDAGQEYETQVGVAHLQRAVEVTHHVAKHRQITLLMYHVQERSVVLIDQDHHLLPRSLVSPLDKALQALVDLYLAFSPTILGLVIDQFPLQLKEQVSLIHVLGRTHVEMEYRMARPLLLQLLDRQALEQLLAPLEIAAERTRQQRLAEAAGTAQEDIAQRTMYQPIDQVRLIDIYIVTLPQFRESLYSYRI